MAAVASVEAPTALASPGPDAPPRGDVGQISPSAEESVDLPDGWGRYFDHQHQAWYYRNWSARLSVWERPSNQSALPLPSPAPPATAPLMPTNPSPHRDERHGRRPWQGRGQGRRHIFEAEAGLFAEEEAPRDDSRQAHESHLGRSHRFALDIVDPWGPPLEPAPLRASGIEQSPAPTETAGTVASSSNESPAARSHVTGLIDATTQTTERRLPLNAPPAPLLMVATRAYDGMEQSSGRLVLGYLAVVEGELLEVRSAAPADGHPDGRFNSYLYAKAADGRRGWVPDFVLVPYDSSVHMV